MKLSKRPHGNLRSAEVAFSLIEVMVGMGIVGVVFISLYAGISSGFAVISMARENLRATQVMQDRIEEMRLYTWDQICSFGSSTSYIPSTFTEPYYPSTTDLAASDLSYGTDGTTPTTTTSRDSAGSFSYVGRLKVTDPGISESYSNNLKLIIVSVVWTNGNVRRERTMSTFVSQYGMQNYIY